MSSLQSLPLELLLSVADYLTSRELFSLCVTCKQYWKELEPVVQKKRQAEEYREIDFSAFDYEARATLQHLLLENPSLLHFVEKVIIEKELHSYEVVCDENGTMLGRRWKRRDLDTSNAFISLIRDDSLLYSLHGIEGDEPEEYRNKLEQAIRDGDDGPLLAYFLELVPNLEELHLPLIPYMWSDSWMFSSVKQIVVAYSGVHRSLPLQRLTRIEFTDHYPTVVKLDWVFCAMRIPSLRSLRVSARSQVQGSDARVDQCVALSNIDDLELDFEAIAPETVSQILASVRSLKRFSLSLAGWCNRSFDSSAILRKLVTQTSHSLESVSFNWNPYWENVVRDRIHLRRGMFCKEQANVSARARQFRCEIFKN